ncbi:hypothetical protein ACWCO3_16190 [Micromonospora sp. NPDC002411]
MTTLDNPLTMQIFGEAPPILSYFSDNQPVLDFLQIHGLDRRASACLESDVQIGLMRASFINEHAADLPGMTSGLLRALAALGRTFVRRESTVYALLALRPSGQPELHELTTQMLAEVPRRALRMEWLRKSALVAKSEDRYSFSPAVCADLVYQLIGLLCVTGRIPVAVSFSLALLGADDSVVRTDALPEMTSLKRDRGLPREHLFVVEQVVELFSLPPGASILVSAALTHSSWSYGRDLQVGLLGWGDPRLVLATLGSAALSYEYALAAATRACEQLPPSFQFQDLTQAEFVKSFDVVGLKRGVLLSPGEWRLGVRPRMASEFFKAVVGAVYLSKGHPVALAVDWPADWAGALEHIAPGALRMPSPIDALTKTLKTTGLVIEAWRVVVDGPKHAELFRASLTLRSAALDRTYTVQGKPTAGHDARAKSSAAQIVLDALVADYEEFGTSVNEPLANFISDHFSALTEEGEARFVREAGAATGAPAGRRYRYVAVEAYKPARAPSTDANSPIVGRPEAALVGRYLDWLVGSGNRLVPRHRISLPGNNRYLLTDMFDTFTFELVEAKSSAGRDSIRLAIGQLFDYARYVSHRSLAVLLPVKPEGDMVVLLASLGISCIYEIEPGKFNRIEPSSL